MDAFTSLSALAKRVAVVDAFALKRRKMADRARISKKRVMKSKTLELSKPRKYEKMELSVSDKALERFRKRACYGCHEDCKKCETMAMCMI